MILGISFPLKTQSITQWTQIEPTGLAMLMGNVVVATANGIHILDNPENDNGVGIHGYLETVRTDFGSHNLKSIRSVYVRGRIKKLGVVLKTENDPPNPILYESSTGELTQEEGYLQGRRDQEGCYWQLHIENIDCTDFSLDAIDVLPIVKPPKKHRLPGRFKTIAKQKSGGDILLPNLVIT